MHANDFSDERRTFVMAERTAETMTTSLSFFVRTALRAEDMVSEQRKMARKGRVMCRPIKRESGYFRSVGGTADLIGSDAGCRFHMHQPSLH